MKPPSWAITRRINDVVKGTMRVVYRKQEWELEGRRRVRDAIEAVGVNPATVLAVRQGKLLTEDVWLDEEDELKLVAVISGG